METTQLTEAEQNLIDAAKIEAAVLAITGAHKQGRDVRIAAAGRMQDARNAGIYSVIKAIHDVAVCEDDDAPEMIDALQRAAIPAVRTLREMGGAHYI